MPTKPSDNRRDTAATWALLLYVVLLALFPVRNNDIWWHLAVGKILAAGSFVTHDPFMYSAPGQPWVPHAWLASLVFYAAWAAASATGLVLLRAALVGATFWLLLRLLRRFRVSSLLAAPLVVVAVLNAQTRFIIRPHLFEYLFVMVLLTWLVGCSRFRGLRFFVPPLVLQVLWVNTHASFYLGPLIAALFFAGEWIASRRPRLIAVSFFNPKPAAFVLEPLGGEQRSLLTRYTMEWHSPFAANMSAAPFHPYYEILLAFIVTAFVLSLERLRPATWLIVIFFTALSLEAHRFRVEMALVAVPLVLEQLRDAPAITKLCHRLRARPLAAPLAAAAVAILMVGMTANRFEIGRALSDRFPDDAFAFVEENDIAHRPFHSVAFGSYLTWRLYPKRQCFVDGRNIDAQLYRDFLACQTNSAGFNAVIRKYDLDAFIIPAPEKSDGGMRNLHTFLDEAREWSLVHIDRNGFVYVKRPLVEPDWLDRVAYETYHPMTFGGARFSENELARLEGELARASAEDPRYARPAIDRALFLAGTGRSGEALEIIDAVLDMAPNHEEALAVRRRLGGQ
jgi:hypothetical protein